MGYQKNVMYFSMYFLSFAKMWLPLIKIFIPTLFDNVSADNQTSIFSIICTQISWAHGPKDLSVLCWYEVALSNWSKLILYLLLENCWWCALVLGEFISDTEAYRSDEQSDGCLFRNVYVQNFLLRLLLLNLNYLQPFQIWKVARFYLFLWFRSFWIYECCAAREWLCRGH